MHKSFLRFCDIDFHITVVTNETNEIYQMNIINTFYKFVYFFKNLFSPHTFFLNMCPKCVHILHPNIEKRNLSNEHYHFISTNSSNFFFTFSHTFFCEYMSKTCSHFAAQYWKEQPTDDHSLKPAFKSENLIFLSKQMHEWHFAFSWLMSRLID